MEALRFENMSFRYARGTGNALENICFSVEKGEFVTIIGPSGSGKTTLLRHLKPEIAPFGALTGRILFEKKPLGNLSEREQSEKIGFVFQSPDDQLVTDKVWSELAFGLESLGLSNSEIRLRVAETAAFFGIENLFRRDVSTLSGGEKQMVNLASIMAMQPKLLVLDEPTGQLDPIAAGEFFGALKRINLELGTTVILSEHRTEEAVPLSDKLIVLDGGKLAAAGSPREVSELLRRQNIRMFLSMPTPTRVWSSVPNALPCPLSVREGRLWLENLSGSKALLTISVRLPQKSEAETVVELNEVWFRHKRDGADVLRGFSARVKRGEIFALMGGNGAGKTTALSVMAGLSKPYRGKVGRRAETALLPQDPRILFLRATLKDDLSDTFSEISLEAEEKTRLFGEAVSLCGLEGLLESHPYDLSGGQLQMAALAKLWLISPDVFLLDEPTKGLDAVSKEKLAALLRSLCDSGKSVVLASHDVEFCARCADRCAMLFDGELIGTAPPHEFFTEKNFYTTAAHRMSRGTLDGAILPEEVILACGGDSGTPPTGSSSDVDSLPPAGNAPSKQNEKDEGTGGERKKTPEMKPLHKKKKKPRTKQFFSILFLLALIPVTVYFGLRYFGERRVYFVSLLVLLESMLPFFIVFEGRRPRPRELVLIAVFCALAVCGRLAFYMLPQIKPTLALVIIAGACLGGEIGFLVGAMTALISNFFFGQGPWTPWQMFATGIVGLFSGLVFSRPNLLKNRIAFCAFGFFTCVVLYGGIMNPASVLITQAEPTPGAILSALLVGLPFDLIQGAATAVFLGLLAPAFIEKLDRIKLKYGIAIS